MIRLIRIRPNAVDFCYREIGLAAAAARQMAGTAPRLVVDDPVTERRLDLTQIGPREMIALFRQVVVGRIGFGREYSLGHDDTSYSFGPSPCRDSPKLIVAATGLRRSIHPALRLPGQSHSRQLMNLSHKCMRILPYNRMKRRRI